MTIQATKPVTADELVAMGDIGRAELVRGEIVMMSPAGFEHGRIAAKLGRVIGTFVDQHQLGVVLAAETGFTIEHAPDSVLAPDVAFVVSARNVATSRYFDGAPDVAIEVMSPSDTWSQVNAKVDAWLSAGCRSCWVVDPETRTVTIHRTPNVVVRLKPGDTISDEPVLPGFAFAVDAVFSL
jgi:Uma2 family endonuclease